MLIGLGFGHLLASGLMVAIFLFFPSTSDLCEDGAVGGGNQGSCFLAIEGGPKPLHRVMMHSLGHAVYEKPVWSSRWVSCQDAQRKRPSPPNNSD